ncbi:hypothetical protein CMV_030072 [Castanea mollissima]|uniref:Uncharacterized protein n=1 Tax=Castanea mollissima TaxID=60419 RepID=A0A8J4VA90_9ROSI|nr:hypothetical protein CMV_030072 [Castanea mollissima]
MLVLLLLPLFFSPLARDSYSSDRRSLERFLDLILLLLPLFCFFGYVFSRQPSQSHDSERIPERERERRSSIIAQLLQRPVTHSLPSFHFRYGSFRRCYSDFC